MIRIIICSDTDYGEMEFGTCIFEDLDPNNASITYDEEFTREFEPLEKGVSPVTVVQGNMVCNDMHIVCAFDSDKVLLSIYLSIEWPRNNGRSYLSFIINTRNHFELSNECEHLLSF